MKKSIVAACVLALWVYHSSLQAQIRLPAVIGDNMVLQQNSEAAVWGWGDPGAGIKVTGSWNNDTVKTKITNHAFWSVKLKTPAAGGPYTVHIKSGNELTIKNVMIGEVWICSGQSNMEWSAGHNLKNAEEEIINANYPNIRLLHVKKIASPVAQDNCFAKWEECSPVTMKTFSSVGYFFSRRLYKTLNIPVGIIEAAWGGTPAEVWVKEELITADSLLASCADRLKTYDWWPSKPGVTYNAMIAPLVPYTIAGAIWYQGESNADSPESYRKLLGTLVQNWRTDFGRAFPFYFVQIAPFTYGQGTKAPVIREMQMQTAGDIPKTGMVVVSDLVDDVTDIHPSNKQDVGLRLANWALGEQYGIQGLSYKHPQYESMKIEKSRIRISFANVTAGLVVKGENLACFEIAGADKNFVPAEAKIDGNTVIVSAREVKSPVAVRFSFSNAAIGNLFSREGLPVAPFRTDNWDY